MVQALYEDNRREYLRVEAVALARATVEPEVDLVWTYLTQADLADAGVGPDETDDLIDLIRTVRDVDVAAVLKQQRDGRFKVSMRSRGEHDLAAIAAAFGGGGHRLAAGYTSEHGPAGTIARLVAALRDARAPSRDATPEGLLLVDKPGGMTSHDVVDVVRRTLGTRKVGHAGTLDPMATGLLVLGVGRATRLLRFLGDLPKTYEGSARLGVETDHARRRRRGDARAAGDGDRGRHPSGHGSLVGDSLQTPPAYSAVKVGGRKLYEAARKGEVAGGRAPPDPRATRSS